MVDSQRQLTQRAPQHRTDCGKVGRPVWVVGHYLNERHTLNFRTAADKTISCDTSFKSA
jgi:hypothetical protein